MHVVTWEGGSVNKEHAGERKRTVTVVVGTATVELMERLNTRLAEASPAAQRQGLAGLAGAALDFALATWRQQNLGEGTGERWNHYD